MPQDPVREVRVAHASPGRLRLKVQRELLENGLLHEAEPALNGVTGVYEVRANPLAGSILVRYDSNTVGLAELLGAVNRAGLTIVPEADTPVEQPLQDRSTLSRAIGNLFQGADQRMAKSTSGTIDLRTLVPVGLAALAVREALMGRLGAVPWYTLLWYAYSTFEKSGKGSKPPPEAASKADAADAPAE
jgi:copper chaperone CopZ